MTGQRLSDRLGPGRCAVRLLQPQGRDEHAVIDVRGRATGEQGFDAAEKTQVQDTLITARV